MNQRDVSKRPNWQMKDWHLVIPCARKIEHTLITPSSYFSIAAAISLTWTKHAKLEAEYVEYAARFIDGKLPMIQKSREGSDLGSVRRT